MRRTRSNNKVWIFLVIVFLLIVGAGQNSKDKTSSAPVSVPDVIAEVTAAPISEPTETSLQGGGRVLVSTPTRTAALHALTPAPTSTASERASISLSVPEPTPTYAPTSAPTYTLLRSGDSGLEVVALQERLADLGYAVGKADGDYGAKTISAIKTLQILAGLPITGIADDQTQQILWELDAPTPQPKPTPTIKPTKRPTPEPEPVDEGSEYILNKNTKKFHYSWCSSVGQMKESNKIYFDGTSAQARKKGYKPCKRCNP